MTVMLVYMEGMSYITSLVSGSMCKDSISVIRGVSHLCIVFLISGTRK